MSLRLSPIVEGKPPYKMKLELRCDGHAPEGGDTLTITGDSFTAMFDEAKKLGWSRITGGNTLGPCCG